MIDLDLGLFERSRFEKAMGEGSVVLHEDDSARALAAFPDAYFDWIYIDGDHSYAGVKRDIEQAKKKVKQDGTLVFNDYIFWSHAELMEYGVIQAINEFCLDEDWGLHYLALESQMYCDVAIRRLPRA